MRNLSSTAMLFAVGVLCLLHVDVVRAAHFKLCYLYFGSIGDLGWTFSFNLGRLNTHDRLTRAFPQHTFESIATQNVFFSGNAYGIAEAYAQSGCSFILSNNEMLLGGQDDLLATTYPAVSFVLLNDAKITNTAPSNRVYVGFDYAQGYYVAGAGAAAQSQRCIAFFAAWGEFLNPVAAFAGFLTGVRSVNSTVAVHVVVQNSWYDPSSDDVLTAKFLELGCDVIAHYSDPREVDLQVSSATVGSRSVFSIGPHANLQQYVGDTVLTAVYLDWAAILTPIISTRVSTGALDQSTPLFYGISGGIMTVAPTSPIATDAARSAMATAQAAVEASGSSPVCGPLTLRDGSTYTYAAGACLTLNENIGNIVVDAHTTAHPDFQASSSCAAGSRYAYVFNPTLQLSCTPCPAGTYSVAAGSSSCTACKSGEESDAGATSCRTVPLLSAGAVAGIVIGAAVVFIGGGVFVFFSGSATARNRTAPREAPLCLLFTDVESSTSLWQSFPASMAIAMETHHNVIREVIKNNGAYEVKTVGDAFMIATKRVVDGVLVAIEIQRALQAASWPSDLRYGTTRGDAAVWNGLRVRIGVHYCTDVIPKYEALQQYYDYYGNDVNISARVESSGMGGQVVMTTETYEQLVQDSEYDTLIGDDAVISLWAKNVTLKGVEGVVALFSCVPAELHGRQFPAPEGCEPQGDGLEASDKRSATDASSRAGAVVLTMHTVAAAVKLMHNKLPHDAQKAFRKLLASGYALEGNKANNVKRLASAVSALLLPPSEEQVQAMARRASRRASQLPMEFSVNSAVNSAVNSI